MANKKDIPGITRPANMTETIGILEGIEYDGEIYDLETLAYLMRLTKKAPQHRDWDIGPSDKDVLNGTVNKALYGEGYELNKVIVYLKSKIEKHEYLKGEKREKIIKKLNLTDVVK